MSEIRRAYDMLRGYINHEWERIRSIDLERAWEELQSERTSASDTETGTAPESPETPMDPKEVACGILGVKVDADFDEIKHAFDRLNKRSKPSNFPEGSEERANASKIQARVNWAYRVLTDDKSEMEKRFRSLEIE